MKKTHYIIALLASLSFCIGLQAQSTEATPAAETTTAEASTTTTNTTTYSTSDGSVTISSNGSTQSISVEPRDGQAVNIASLLKKVAVQIADSDEEKSAVSQAIALALSQAINTLSESGAFPSTTSSSFSVEIGLTPSDDGSYTAQVSMTADNSTTTAALKVATTEDGSYAVTGTVADAAVNVEVAPSDDSFSVTGDVGGEEVKSTVSTQADPSATVESTTSTTVDNATGNVVSETTAVNNGEGTYTVTTTDSAGNETSETYEGDLPNVGSTETPNDTTSSSSSSNVENLGGVGESANTTNPEDETGFDVEIPDDTIVTPEINSTYED